MKYRKNLADKQSDPQQDSAKILAYPPSITSQRYSSIRTIDEAMDTQMDIRAKVVKEDGVCPPIDKEATEKFLKALYRDYFKINNAYIDIRQINGETCQKRGFYSTPEDLIKDLDHYKENIFFGIAPRFTKKGSEEYINAATCLWTDIDYGETHSNPGFEDEEDAFEHIFCKVYPKPSIIVNSGYGFHLYWLLKFTELSSDEEKTHFKNILAGLIVETKGDDCGDLARPFRLPGTNNCKHKEIKETEIISIHPYRIYSLQDFDNFAEIGKNRQCIPDDLKAYIAKTEVLPYVNREFLKKRKIPPVIIRLIERGDNEGRYKSRSHRDQAIITILLLKGFNKEEISSVFANHKNAVSDRYLEKRQRRQDYLARSIRNAEAHIEENNLIYQEPEQEYREIRIPKPAYDFAIEYLRYDEKLIPEDIHKADEDYIVYRKLDDLPDKTIIRQYQIQKTEANPAEEILLNDMRNALYLSLKIAQKQCSPTIQFTIDEKAELFYGNKQKISAERRRRFHKAEELLYQTSYQKLTRTKENEQDSIGKLYSSFRPIKKGGKTAYEVTLSPDCLEGIDFETGFLEGQYFTIPLPLTEPRSTKDKFIQRSKFILGNMGATHDSKRKAMNYNLVTHLKKIGIQSWQLKRKQEVKKIWKYIEPTFKEAGHKILKRTMKQAFQEDDLRGLKLLVEFKTRKKVGKNEGQENEEAENK